MTALTILSSFLFFSVAEVLNFYFGEIIYFDIQIPLTIFFIVRSQDIKMPLAVVALAMLAGLSQGHLVHMLFFSAVAAYLISISREFFLISAHRFIAVFTMLALAAKCAIFYVITYRGMFVSQGMTMHYLIYIIMNTIMAPVFYEAFARFYTKINIRHEKGLHYT